MAHATPFNMLSHFSPFHIRFCVRNSGLYLFLPLFSDIFHIQLKFCRDLIRLILFWLVHVSFSVVDLFLFLFLFCTFENTGLSVWKHILRCLTSTESQLIAICILRLNSILIAVSRKRPHFSQMKCRRHHIKTK